jgi:hypothetical protein
MERRPARDDLVTTALTARDVVLPRQLDRRLGGLGSAGDQVQARVVDRSPLGQRGGELLDRLGRQLGAMHVGELSGLGGDGLGDLSHTVADADHDGAAGGVDESTPGVVPDEGAFAAYRARKRPARALAIEDRMHERDSSAPGDRRRFCRRTIVGQYDGIMRFIVIAVLSIVLGLDVAPVHAQTLDSASSEALAAALRMLTDPGQRAGAIAGNSDARAMDQKIRALTGSDQLTEELYGLAAQIFEELGRSQGGDVGKMLGALEQGRGDPAAFAAMLSPATLARLRELATRISDQRK